jgi:hypothetical protein
MNVQVEVLLHLSVAVKLTDVFPNGKTPPEGILPEAAVTTTGVLQSLATGIGYITLAWQSAVLTLTLSVSDGQFANVGGVASGVITILDVAVELAPQPSVTVHCTKVELPQRLTLAALNELVTVKL